MEKERYEFKYNEKIMKHYMFDNFTKTQLGYEDITNLLNQQDKRIKELENMNSRLSQGIYWGNGEHFCDVVSKLKKESQQLKQELKDERAELQQLYSHLEVEAFGEDIQEQAVKEIDKIKEENKQLKQQLEEYKTYKDWQDILCCKSAQEVIDFVMSNYLTEDEKCRTIADLKQQLHDLPKKIVEEIKNNCWYCGALLEDDYYKVTDKLLDAILKKFGGENE